MPGQWGQRNTAKGTFFGINQLVVVAVDPKDADKDGDSPGDVDDGEEDPGELRSKVFCLIITIYLADEDSKKTCFGIHLSMTLNIEHRT